MRAGAALFLRGRTNADRVVRGSLLRGLGRLSLNVSVFKTYIRTAVQHNGKKLSTIQKSFPHGQWVDYDCDSMISGMKSKAGFQKSVSIFGSIFEHLFENRHKLEIIGPNHLRIETVKTQTQPFDPRYGASGLQHSRCGGELLYSDIPGILKQTQKGIPNSHGYDHRGISYNRLGQPSYGQQNFSSCGCTPKLTKGTHGVTFGIPGKDFKRVQ